MIDSLKNKEEPRVLDSIELSVDGVKLHVYGILHGVLGGANKQYVEAVNRTIAESQGVRYCEKSMKALYQGLDHEVADWLALTNKEIFKFSFCSLINPVFWSSLCVTMLSESFSKPKFGANGIHTYPGSVTSTHFHLLPPQQRRLICGFPDAEEYLKLNILRREHGVKMKFRFADSDWRWLEIVEQNAAIPLRSIHMLEYALYHAKKHGINELSLFVGEIHNSDIEWYASVRDKPKSWFESYQKRIQEVVVMAIEKPSFVRRESIKYGAISLAAGFLALAPYVLIASAMLS